jgi:phosphatidylserine/phosphatidylglycerophosphate/cardiolipin synthase-like enzyme
MVGAIKQARELIYIETPLLAHTAAGAGGPTDPNAAVDLITELTGRLTAEPGLRVLIMVPRNLPFGPKFDPWAMHFYAARNQVVQTLQLAAGKIEGRDRVVVAHPMGIPGRPLTIRTTTVIVDDVWCLVGTSNLSRRGLTFDGASDMVLVDRQLDRGAGVSIRAYRKALMAAHLGVSPTANPPAPEYVQLHQLSAAHRTVADIVAQNGRGKFLPLWTGPDPNALGAPIPHPPEVADPDGKGGASTIVTIAGALAGTGAV